MRDSLTIFPHIYGVCGCRSTYMEQDCNRGARTSGQESLLSTEPILLCTDAFFVQQGDFLPLHPHDARRLAVRAIVVLAERADIGHSSRVARRSAQVKDFRCGPWCNVSWRCFVGPRWKSSQGGSRGGRALSMGKVGLGIQRRPSVVGGSKAADRSQWRPDPPK